MPKEDINQDIEVNIADHPKRTDSPTYIKSRKWLSGVPDACFVCHGPTDMIHPESDKEAFQDHHGGGIYMTIDRAPELIGLSLFGMEWSLGFNANPSKVQGYVNNLNIVEKALGYPTYDLPITTAQEVCDYVDSIYNANIRLCKVHHIGMETEDSKDFNGNQGVGIHFCPLPIWLGQVTCDWERVDMWAGTTGQVATYVQDNKVKVAYVSKAHPLFEEHQKQLRDKGEHVLDPEDPMAKATLRR